MTIKELLLGTHTEAALDMLIRADRMFSGSRHGRHFSGRLTPAEVEELVVGLELKPETKKRVEEFCR